MKYTEYVLVEFLEEGNSWLKYQIKGLLIDPNYPDVKTYHTVFETHDVSVCQAAWHLIKTWNTHERIVEKYTPK
jgi:hypothetical protein